MMTNNLDRELRLRVYHDGRIVAMVHAPASCGGRLISHTVFTSWRGALALVERVQKRWVGLRYEIRVQQQGVDL